MKAIYVGDQYPEYKGFEVIVELESGGDSYRMLLCGKWVSGCQEEDFIFIEETKPTSI